MSRPIFSCLKAAPILLLISLSYQCRTKPAVVHAPAVNVQEVVAQADSNFNKAYLVGWLQAESAYRKACDLDGSDVLRDKLLLTRFLIVTREIDEDIVDPPMERAFEGMCSAQLNARQHFLCELATRYKAGTRAKAAGAESLDPGMLDVDNSAVDAYIYTLYVQVSEINESNEVAGARAEKNGESPLFVYLYLGNKASQRADEFERKFPEFAELFDFMGGLQFQRTRYTSARNYFKKAIDLVPGYSRSWNGLGNISLFALEDNEKALEYFKASLEQNPDNSAALYGTALVLHHQGKYADSNSYLERMLASDLSRGGHTSEDAVRYYQGEANYYMAYNFYLQGNRAEAREFVEAARKYIPRSEHVNYLSGLLYYGERQLQPAREEFMRVLAAGSNNCDAQYHLGRIYRETKDEIDERPQEQMAGINIPKNLADLLKEIPVPREPKEKKSLDYFLGACSCMESTVRGMERQVTSIPSLDLDPAEKLVLQGRMNNKLVNYRRTSASLIDGMLRMVSDSATEQRDSYMDLMREVQTRLASAEGTAGSAQNSP